MYGTLLKFAGRWGSLLTTAGGRSRGDRTALYRTALLRLFCAVVFAMGLDSDDRLIANAIWDRAGSLFRRTA